MRSLELRPARSSLESARIYIAPPPKNMRWPARRDVHADEAFPADWIVESTEASIKRLGVEAVDLQQFHVWSDHWLGQGSWQEAIEALKADGKIRAFGISINNHEPSNAIALVRSGLVECVQVIYNVFDQSPEDELFPATEAAGVGVIVRVPFDEGALTGTIRPDTTFPDGDFRNAYFAGDRKQEVWARAQSLAGDLSVDVNDLAAVALRFAFTHLAISTVIPGMRSLRHVESNASAARSGRLRSIEIEVLRRHRWVRSFYG